MCCNKGYAYDHNVQGCAPDPYCKLHCAERENVQTTIAPTTPKMSMESKITRITNESNCFAMFSSPNFEFFFFFMYFLLRQQDLEFVII